MRAVVVQCTTGGFVIGLPIPATPKAVPADTDELNLTQNARLTDFFDLLEVDFLATLLERLKHLARLLGGGEHTINICNGQAKRFFAKHMLASFECGSRLCCVMRIHAGHDDQ